MGETHILLLRRRSLTLRGEKRRTLEGLSVMVPGLLGMWAFHGNLKLISNQENQ